MSEFIPISGHKTHEFKVFFLNSSNAETAHLLGKYLNEGWTFLDRQELGQSRTFREGIEQVSMVHLIIMKKSRKEEP